MKNLTSPYHRQRGVSKPVVQIKDGVIINKYSSISEAARKNNVCFSNISDVIHGICSHARGYQWRYLDYEMPETAKKNKQNKPCKVIFEKRFDNLQSANDFITEKGLTDIKIVFTKNRLKK